MKEDGPREVLVLTGLSGAGRTTAAKVLEDLDTFVIDNLPPSLIGRVVELAGEAGGSVDRLAVVTDVRGGRFFDDLEGALEDLRAAETPVKVVFLEADDDELVRRFEESRRRHPAAGLGGIIDGIRAERERLSELRGRSDLVIDTTGLNVHQLRDRVIELLGEGGSAPLTVDVISFGYKRGLPRQSDLVFDVRFLPNPHWVDELRPYSGLDEPVREYVLSQEEAGPFLDRLRDLLELVVPGFLREGKRYLTVAVGCTGGKHRSVVIAEEIGRWLADKTDLPVRIKHRDVNAE